jgi:hypothetical protein
MTNWRSRCQCACGCDRRSKYAQCTYCAAGGHSITVPAKVAQPKYPHEPREWTTGGKFKRTGTYCLSDGEVWPCAEARKVQSATPVGATQ